MTAPEQDEAALVAEWKEKHQCVLRLTPNSAAYQLGTILRLAEEALASRKVVEAARVLYVMSQADAVDATAWAQAHWPLLDAVKALDAADTGGEP